MNTKKVIALLIPLLFVVFFLVNPATAEIVYEYDFEAGWGHWCSDNGIWEVGEPTESVPQAPIVFQTVQGPIWMATILAIRPAD